MIYGVFILVAAVGLLWLAYRRPRPRRWLLPRRVAPRAVAAVDRQHRHLQAGGLLGERACEATKTRFRELLGAGRASEVERELHAGLDFAVRVRALTALGTPEAGRVLERVLGRFLASDAPERAWYWLDVAAALRVLGRNSALPAVLRCADAAAGLPQGALLAAEAVGFTNFQTALTNLASDSGRAALRALVAAGRGARAGALDPAPLVRAGLGDLLAEVTGRAGAVTDLTGAVIEAERHARRLGHWAKFLPPDARVLAEHQAMRLWATSDRRRVSLSGAPERLLARFPQADADERGAILRCLADLRADVTKLFPHLPDRRAPWWADAVRALTWAQSPVVGPVLAGTATALARKARHRTRAAVVLGALRGHPCYETERVLIRSASAPDALLRHTAAGALGWWPPFDPAGVVRALRAARADSDPDTRASAVAALARLGERAALAEVAAGLSSEEPAIRQHTAARIAVEELSWLWPNLETAAEASDPDTALAAIEALESLRERIFGLAR